MSTNLHNSALIAAFSGSFQGGDLDLAECAIDLEEKQQKVKAGNLGDMKALLTGQAYALDSMMAALGLRAAKVLDTNPAAAERYLRLAMKAQNQCRATAESIAEITNPKPYIQHNNAHYQQVNNSNIEGIEEDAPRARARETRSPKNNTLENQKPANELLVGAHHGGATMDIGTTAAASQADSAMATVAALNRPEDGQR